MTLPILRPSAFCALLCASLPLSTHAEPAREPLKPVSATASSEQGKNAAANTIDGIITDDSRWISKASEEPAWLVIDLGKSHEIAGLHFFSGYRNGDAIQNFEVQFEKDGKWITIPSAAIHDNGSPTLAIAFDSTVDVVTSKLRLWITRTPQNTARILEVIVWPGQAGDIPALKASPKAAVNPDSLICNIPWSGIPPIYLNQSGFNAGQPKRFTVPAIPNGTHFEVRPVGTTEAAFKGTVQGHIGDFTSFEPNDNREYIVVTGDLTSVPFRIGPNWLERTLYQNSIDFLIDARQHIGNNRATAKSSYAWRDDHHFAWVLHAIVPQYLSNPSAYERMPRQIAYVAPTDKRDWGNLEPYDDKAPDIVKLIHWGADIIVSKNLSHEHFKAQLAYFLHAWPVLEKWLPRQNYVVVSEYAFREWANPEKRHDYPYDESPENNLFALKTRIGDTKGAYPPGFSVEPNLLMHEVALRDKRPDADRYFKAAYDQVEWMIANLDWNDPIVTKGQRISEFLTMTGMAHMLSQYPDRAPAGLKEKINEWAKVAIRRSENYWDFRKLDDQDGWCPTGPKPTMWNEPGNVVGFPACLMAAHPFVSPGLQPRLNQLVWSHFDNMSGRNPVGRHFGFRAQKEVEGVEIGWYRRYPGGIGMLRDVRFVIDGSPKQQHYPHNPQIGDVGWTEGWIQHNTPLNLSLGYLARSNSRLDLKRDGKQLAITLKAPLNFDYSSPESGTVSVDFGNGKQESVTVTETGPSTGIFTGSIAIPANASTIRASYGFGYLGTHAKL